MIETAYQVVAVLTMRHGKVNALDAELCQALCGALDQPADRAQAVMLTGTGTVFSAASTSTGCSPGGTNTWPASCPNCAACSPAWLPTNCPWSRRQRARHRRRVHPRRHGELDPDGQGTGRAGVTELLVGVPFPAIALELLHMRTGDAPPARSSSTVHVSRPGRADLAPDRRGRGRRDLASRSLATAQRLVALGPAFRLTKRQLRLQSLARAEELAVLDADVDAAWQAPPALDRVRAYLAALKSPPGCQ